MKPRLLDLFCGAGGATKGYQRAGFHVVGVDIAPQLDYCGDDFHQADAIGFLADVVYRSGAHFDVIHASPPCQAHTNTSNRWRGTSEVADSHIDLIPTTRDLLRETDTLWIIENVVGARSLSPTITLHGGMFGLEVHRPRHFESNVLLMAPKTARATGTVGVYGQRPDGRRLNNNTKQLAVASFEEAQRVMGMPWVHEWRGIAEAIPPAYTQFLGQQLMQFVERETVA